MALSIPIPFQPSHRQISNILCVVALITISASYTVCTHNRRSYHNREFNRFDAKKFHTHHHNYEGHIKQALQDGQFSPTFDSLQNNLVFDKPGRGKSFRTASMKGNCHFLYKITK